MGKWVCVDYVVITVVENHNTDGTSGETPRGLPSELLVLIVIEEVDVEHLREVLAEMMRCRSLHGTSVRGNACFNRGREVRTRELFVLTLHSLNHGHSK